MEILVQNAKDFFEEYTTSFDNFNQEQQKNAEIKKNHSYRVADNCRWLAIREKKYSFDLEIAYTIGLLHDIGRFQQLADYKTFDDSKSVDHAEFGINLLKDNVIFDALDDEMKNVVFHAIQYHNKFELPKKLSQLEMLYAKLLRDADKMDILRVITEYYSNQKKQPNHTLTWELPKGSVVSKKVAKTVLAGNQVLKDDLETDIDVKILQLSWIFDLNLRSAFEFVLENRFLEKIYNTLSKTDTIIEIYRKVKVYAENKILV